MVTIKDIAEKAGVSYSTVSRSLNDYAGTNDETKKRIKELAKQMGYEPNDIARSLVTRRSNTVGFVLPDIANPFFADILSAINEIAEMHGFNTLVCSTGWNADKELQALKMLSSKRVDGIVLYPARLIEDDRLEVIKPPVIVMGRPYDPEKNRIKCVEVDNDKGARLAIDHLVASGYSRIAYLGGPNHSLSNIIRKQAFADELIKKQFACNEEWISDGEYTIDSGCERARTLLKQTSKNAKQLPDALLCANDMIALGAMQAVEELGFKLGKDIAVMGFDDVQYASLPQIQLSTISIPRFELGRISMQMLIEAIEQQPIDKAGRTNNSKYNLALQQEVKGYRVLLYPELIVRKTTVK